MMKAMTMTIVSGAIDQRECNKQYWRGEITQLLFVVIGYHQVKRIYIKGQF